MKRVQKILVLAALSNASRRGFGGPVKETEERLAVESEENSGEASATRAEDQKLSRHHQEPSKEDDKSATGEEEAENKSPATEDTEGNAEGKHRHHRHHHHANAGGHTHLKQDAEDDEENKKEHAEAPGGDKRNGDAEKDKEPTEIREKEETEEGWKHTSSQRAKFFTGSSSGSSTGNIFSSLFGDSKYTDEKTSEVADENNGHDINEDELSDGTSPIAAGPVQEEYVDPLAGRSQSFVSPFMIDSLKFDDKLKSDGNVYIGDTEQYTPPGSDTAITRPVNYGRVSLKDGKVVYEGFFTNGKLDRYATYTRKGAYECHGFWRKGKRHGEQQCRFYSRKDASKEIMRCSAFFVDNHPSRAEDAKCKSLLSSGIEYIGGVNKHFGKHGRGVLKHKSGNIVEGRWENDKLHGQRVVYRSFNEQTVCEADFVEDQRAGKVLCVFKNEGQYLGEGTVGPDLKWTLQGAGTFTFMISGDVWEGSWVNGKRQGPGVLTRRNGDVIKGNWEADVLSGSATFSNKDGSKKCSGAFESSKPRGDFTCHFKSQDLDGNGVTDEYVGRVNEEFEPHGFGSLTQKNQQRLAYAHGLEEQRHVGHRGSDMTYSGEFKNGIRNGSGMWHHTGNMETRWLPVTKKFENFLAFRKCYGEQTAVYIWRNAQIHVDTAAGPHSDLRLLVKEGKTEGRYVEFEEFEKYYGLETAGSQWEIAKKEELESVPISEDTDSCKRRLHNDGRYYDYEFFEKTYGREKAWSVWQKSVCLDNSNIHAMQGGTKADKSIMRIGRERFGISDGYRIRLICENKNWSNNKMNGEGWCLFQNGDFYKGKFLNDRLHGEGKMIYANHLEFGQTYIGQWQFDRRSGRGRLYDNATGEFYSGEWRNDVKNGRGLLKKNSNLHWTERRGTWTDGEQNGVGEIKTSSYTGLLKYIEVLSGSNANILSQKTKSSEVAKAVVASEQENITYKLGREMFDLSTDKDTHLVRITNVKCGATGSLNHGGKKNEVANEETKEETTSGSNGELEVRDENTIVGKDSDNSSSDWMSHWGCKHLAIDDIILEINGRYVFDTQDVLHEEVRSLKIVRDTYTLGTATSSGVDFGLQVEKSVELGYPIIAGTKPGSAFEYVPTPGDRIIAIDGIAINDMSKLADKIRDMRTITLKFEKPEYRISLDGEMLTFAGFENLFGRGKGADMWRDAKRIDNKNTEFSGREKRMSLDGEYYSYFELSNIVGQQSVNEFWEVSKEEAGEVSTIEVREDFFHKHAEDLQIQGNMIIRCDRFWNHEPGHVGFRRGDVILRIDGTPVIDIMRQDLSEDVHAAVSSSSLKKFLSDGKRHTMVVRHNAVERRMALDGEYHDFWKFQQLYGVEKGQLQWEKALEIHDVSAGADSKTGAPAGVERRMALDGEYYPYTAFTIFYGVENADRIWDEALEHAENVLAKSEKRLCPDGQYRDYTGFEAYHGREYAAAAWAKAEDKRVRDALLTSAKAKEKRMAPNGEYYDFDMFTVFYGYANAPEEWGRAKKRSQKVDSVVEKRMGPGMTYHSYAEFEEFFGAYRAPWEWEQAKHRSKKLEKDNHKLEKRIANDGRYYAKEAFHKFFGEEAGDEFWAKSRNFFVEYGGRSMQGVGVEKRMTLNGEYHSYADFVTFYGEARAFEKWEQAKKKTSVPAPTDPAHPSYVRSAKREGPDRRWYNSSEEMEPVICQGRSFDIRVYEAWRDAGKSNDKEQVSPVSEEQRMALDGNYYTFQEFEVLYKNKRGIAGKEWEKAAHTSELLRSQRASGLLKAEKRMCMDGNYYTFWELVDTGGPQFARDAWASAKKRDDHRHDKAAGVKGTTRTEQSEDDVLDSHGALVQAASNKHEKAYNSKLSNTGNIRVEKRMALDGEYYDYIDFLQHYSDMAQATAAWEEAKQSTGIFGKKEKRMAPDGAYYDYHKFELFFGKDKAAGAWEDASKLYGYVRKDRLDKITDPSMYTQKDALDGKPGPIKSGGIEKRISMDGLYRPYDEFLLMYGKDATAGARAWEAAGKVDLQQIEQKKIGLDGNFYTYGEFVERYGIDGARMNWQRAEDYEGGRWSGNQEVSAVRDSDEKRLGSDGEYYTYDQMERFFGPKKGYAEWDKAKHRHPDELKKVERRMAMDGQYYDYVGFIHKYGVHAAWDFWVAAKGLKGVISGGVTERRLSLDGKYSTYVEFERFYPTRNEALQAWTEAASSKQKFQNKDGELYGRGELRMAANGQYYTEEEVLEYYGDEDGKEEWEKMAIGGVIDESKKTKEIVRGTSRKLSDKLREAEVRYAPNGMLHTYQEFAQFFGDKKGFEMWEKAIRKAKTVRSPVRLLGQSIGAHPDHENKENEKRIFYGDKKYYNFHDYKIQFCRKEAQLAWQRAGDHARMKKMADGVRAFSLESRPEARQLTVDNKFLDDPNAQGHCTGTFENNKMRGHVRCDYLNGDSFVGNMEDGQFHGQGKYRYASTCKSTSKKLPKHATCGPEVYEGGFEYNRKHGQGVFKFANGDYYYGEFLSDKKHGQGEYRHLESGDIFGGIFSFDMYQSGTLTFGNGDYQKGAWREGNKFYSGQMRLRDEYGIYQGGIDNFERHGFGTYRYFATAQDMADYDEYSGQWESGKFHGNGKISYINGDFQDGQFRAGKFIDGRVRWTMPDGIYEGEYSDLNRRHGRGEFHYAETGEVYKGEWRLDKRNGFGEVTSPNGDFRKGEFRDDKFISGHGKISKKSIGAIPTPQPAKPFKVERQAVSPVPKEKPLGESLNKPSKDIQKTDTKTGNEKPSTDKENFAEANIENSPAKAKALPKESPTKSSKKQADAENSTTPDDRGNNPALATGGEGDNSEPELGESAEEELLASSAPRTSEDSLLDAVSYEDVLGSYEGELREGDQAHGQGVFKFEDGSTYEGDFDLDQFQGLGIYKWKDNTVYDGFFGNHQMYGMGTIRYSNGDFFEGTLRANQKEASGRYTWKKNDDYKDGHWEKDEFMQGNGKITTREGIYEGEFEGEKRHGLGKVTRTLFGDFEEGEFREDRFVSGRARVTSKAGVYHGQIIGVEHADVVKKQGESGEWYDYVQYKKEFGKDKAREEWARRATAAKVEIREIPASAKKGEAENQMGDYGAFVRRFGSEKGRVEWEKSRRTSKMRLAEETGQTPDDSLIQYKKHDTGCVYNADKAEQITSDLVDVSMDGILTCRNACKSKNAKFFGFECPHMHQKTGLAKVHCQCFPDRPNNPFLQWEECHAHNFGAASKGFQHCNMDSLNRFSLFSFERGSNINYSLGSGNISSIYHVNETDSRDVASEEKRQILDRKHIDYGLYRDFDGFKEVYGEKQAVEKWREAEGLIETRVRHGWGRLEYHGKDNNSTVEKKEADKENADSEVEKRDYEEGDWRDDKLFLGKARITDNNGAYEGPIRKNHKHGQGKIEFTNGDTFEGEWSEGALHGRGLYNWQNGHVHKGWWKDNKISGYGVRTEGEAIFRGHFLDGKKSGHGVLKIMKEVEFTEDEEEAVDVEKPQYIPPPTGEVNSAAVAEKSPSKDEGVNEYLAAASKEEGDENAKGKKGKKESSTKDAKEKSPKKNDDATSAALVPATPPKSNSKTRKTYKKVVPITYSGWFANDQKDGFGVENTGTELYIGVFSKGKRHGLGRVFDRNGFGFQGTWADGDFVSGTGVMFIPKDKDNVAVRSDNEAFNSLLKAGGILEGQFKRGQFEGMGTFHRSDGTQVHGQWSQNHLLNGFGHLSLEDGTQYEGQLDHDEIRQGMGQEIRPNGTYRQGQFVNNVLETGFGVEVHEHATKSGGTWKSLYSGPYKQDARHGVGTEYHSDGTYVYGDWKKGEYNGGYGVVHSTEVEVIDGAADHPMKTVSTLYQGQLDAERNPKGMGIEFDSDGMNRRGLFDGPRHLADGYATEWENRGNLMGQRVYEGQIRDAKRHGKGHETKADGTRISGEWQDGVLFKGHGIIKEYEPRTPEEIKEFDSQFSDGTELAAIGGGKTLPAPESKDDKPSKGKAAKAGKDDAQAEGDDDDADNHASVNSQERMNPYSMERVGRKNKTRSYYEGQLGPRGERLGMGEEVRADGVYFQGKWSNNTTLETGFGVHKTTQTLWEGPLKNNVPHGVGIQTQYDGMYRQGWFENGKFKKGHGVQTHDNRNPNAAINRFSEDDQPVKDIVAGTAGNAATVVATGDSQTPTGPNGELQKALSASAAATTVVESGVDGTAAPVSDKYLGPSGEETVDFSLLGGAGPTHTLFEGQMSENSAKDGQITSVSNDGTWFQANFMKDKFVNGYGVQLNAGKSMYEGQLSGSLSSTFANKNIHTPEGMGILTKIDGSYKSGKWLRGELEVGYGVSLMDKSVGEMIPGMSELTEEAGNPSSSVHNLYATMREKIQNLPPVENTTPADRRLEAEENDEDDVGDDAKEVKSARRGAQKAGERLQKTEAAFGSKRARQAEAGKENAEAGTSLSAVNGDEDMLDNVGFDAAVQTMGQALVGEGKFVKPVQPKFEGYDTDGKAAPKPADRIFEGQWNNGKQTGLGKVIHKDGTQRRGTFANGKLIEGFGTIISHGNELDPDDYGRGVGTSIYTGQLVSDSRKHGSGYIVYEDGRKIQGQFINGYAAQGHGIMFTNRKGDLLQFPDPHNEGKSEVYEREVRQTKKTVDQRWGSRSREEKRKKETANNDVDDQNADGNQEAGDAEGVEIDENGKPKKVIEEQKAENGYSYAAQPSSVTQPFVEGWYYGGVGPVFNDAKFAAQTTTNPVQLVPHGLGEYFGRDGIGYRGNFEGHLKSGYGVIIDEEGKTSYEGMLGDEATRKGFGVEYKSDGTMRQGIFYEDKFQSGWGVDVHEKNGVEIAYEGQMSSAGKEGQGLVYKSDGDWHHGSFKDNQLLRGYGVKETTLSGRAETNGAEDLDPLWKTNKTGPTSWNAGPAEVHQGSWTPEEVAAWENSGSQSGASQNWSNSNQRWSDPQNWQQNVQNANQTWQTGKEEWSSTWDHAKDWQENWRYSVDSDFESEENQKSNDDVDDDDTDDADVRADSGTNEGSSSRLKEVRGLYEGQLAGPSLQRSGFGTFFDGEGIGRQGRWQGDTFAQGFGMIKQEQGLYHGEITNEETIQGVGEYYTKDGYFKHGTWKDNMLAVGYGVIKDHDSDRKSNAHDDGHRSMESSEVAKSVKDSAAHGFYEGTIRNNRQDGLGEYFAKNGSWKQGAWSNGEFVGGMGQIINEDGPINSGAELYEGFIAKGADSSSKHGMGRTTKSDGTWSAGTYLNNELLIGQARIETEEGVYDGSIERGQRKGFGFYLDKDGNSKEGLWENNHSMRGYARQVSKNAEGNLEMYDGEWDRTSRNGLGLAFREDGTFIRGQWENGEGIGYASIYLDADTDGGDGLEEDADNDVADAKRIQKRKEDKRREALDDRKSVDADEGDEPDTRHGLGGKIKASLDGVRSAPDTQPHEKTEGEQIFDSLDPLQQFVAKYNANRKDEQIAEMMATYNNESLYLDAESDEKASSSYNADSKEPITASDEVDSVYQASRSKESKSDSKFSKTKLPSKVRKIKGISNKKLIEGQYVKGQITGFARLLNGDGTYTQGTFQDTILAEGMGAIKKTTEAGDLELYEGQLKDGDVMSGLGRKFGAEQMEQGMWSNNGMVQGYGRISERLENGLSGLYEGQLAVVASGSSGEEQRKKQGVGRWQDSRGVWKHGMWADDVLVQGYGVLYENLDGDKDIDAVYEGMIMDSDRKTGLGTITKANGDYVHGSFLDNNLSIGYGRQSTGTEEVFEGTLRGEDGKFQKSGFGRRAWANLKSEGVQEGIWTTKGLGSETVEHVTGYTRMHDIGSEMYEGGWKDDHKYGVGRAIYKDGTYRQGWWTGNMDMTGLGTEVAPSADGHNDNFFEGEFENNKKVGLGMWMNRRGEWQKGKWNAEGILENGMVSKIESDGSWFHGRNLKGLKYGMGRRIEKNGDWVQGYWAENECKNCASFKTVENQHIYIGQQQSLKIDGKKEGVASNDIHGSGMKIWADGTSEQGLWEENICVDCTATKITGSTEKADGSSKIDKETMLYDGQWSREAKNGFGVGIFADGSHIQGTWLKDECTTCTTTRMENGDLYEGQLLKDVKHGAGRVTKKDGSWFQGRFVDGELENGMTQMIVAPADAPAEAPKENPDDESKQPIMGSFYEGQINQGQRHGTGRLVKADGLFQQGVWSRDECLTCMTVEIDEEKGQMYEGMTHKGERIGLGSISNADGSWQKGIFTENSETCENCMSLQLHAEVGKPATTMFIGQTMNKEKHGVGRLLGLDGSHQLGSFKEDKFDTGVESMVTDGDDAEWFQGEVRKGKRDGLGRIVSKDGLWIQGTFSNGECKNCVGVQTKDDKFYLGQLDGVFPDAKRAGVGFEIQKNGGLITGKWSDDVKCDSCVANVYDENDKTAYFGQYKDKQYEGVGWLMTADGMYRQGVFQKNKPIVGYGRMFMDGGSIVYDGSFKEDRPDGWGKWNSQTGEYYNGQFKDGNRVGYGNFKQLKEQGGAQEIKFMEGACTNGELDGYGAIVEHGDAQSGRMFIGQWQSGRMGKYMMIFHERKFQVQSGGKFGYMNLEFESESGGTGGSIITHSSAQRTAVELAIKRVHQNKLMAGARKAGRDAALALGMEKTASQTPREAWEITNNVGKNPDPAPPGGAGQVEDIDKAEPIDALQAGLAAGGQSPMGNILAVTASTSDLTGESKDFIKAAAEDPMGRIGVNAPSGGNMR